MGPKLLRGGQQKRLTTPLLRDELASRESLEFEICGIRVALGKRLLAAIVLSGRWLLVIKGD